MGVPSRIRKSTAVLAGSCTLPGPRMPIEVLFVVSSLSCCNVSRSACKPWRIRSSRLPVTSGSQTRMHILVSQNGTGCENNWYGTIGKGLKVLLKVRLGALAARTDRNSKVLERGAARGELV
jgi:hypothetical protein